MIIENDYGGYLFFVQFLRPYLQCWRCEKPFGCLQLMLFLYLSDHLCLRVRVRVRGRDLVGINALMDIYIQRKKVVGWNICWFYSYTHH